MKLLIDMNLSPQWIEALADAGIEAHHWSKVGDGAASDREVFQWAQRHGFVLLRPRSRLHAGLLRRRPARRHVRHSKPTKKARPGMLLPTPPFEKAVLASRGSRLIAMKSGWSFLFNRLRTAPVSHSPPPSS